MLKGGYSSDPYDEEEALRAAIASSMTTTSEPCQICNQDLSPLSAELRQSHYDTHFSDSAEGTPDMSLAYCRSTLYSIGP
jgi:hypothetical protein